MGTIRINIIQADIIFKALHFVARETGVAIPKELEEIHSVLAEYNPQDTHEYHTVEVMEHLSDFIANNKVFEEYFEDEDED